MILLIDNYDSFVHNLARYFARQGEETLVVRNDAISVQAVRQIGPDALVLSPGPCTPTEAGVSVPLVRALWNRLPILGVCLGHQAIAAAWSVPIIRAKMPMHGRASEITHAGTGLFSGLPSPLNVGRYHSLAVRDALPEDLIVTARTSDGEIMALSHRKRPVFGVQFHPESILTEFGEALVANFLRIAGRHPQVVAGSAELADLGAAEPGRELLDRNCSRVVTPVTF